MGVMVNAHLGFGVHLQDDQYEDLPWAVFDTGKEDLEEGKEPAEPKLNFEDWVHRVAGLSDPSAHLPDRNESWKKWYSDPAHKALMEDFWRQSRAAVDNCPIQLINVYTGDGGDPCLIVAVSSTVSVGWWGDPQVAITTVSEEDLAAAVEFCAQHQIPFENPQWLLTAEYGG